MAEIDDIADIVAGETISLEFDAPDGATAASISFTGGSSLSLTLADGVFSGLVPSATTLALPRSTAYAIFCTVGSKSVAVKRGTFTVAKLTSDYRDVLTAVEAAIASWGSNANQTISVGEINISYKTLDDLLTLRAYYAGLVTAEESGAATSGGPMNMVVGF